MVFSHWTLKHSLLNIESSGLSSSDLPILSSNENKALSRKQSSKTLKAMNSTELQDMLLQHIVFLKKTHLEHHYSKHAKVEKHTGFFSRALFA